MTELVIGIDQGTTGTFVGLMNAGGEIVGQAYREHRQFYPGPDRVEHDPEEIWNNVRDLLRQVILEAGIEAGHVAGIGIANQGESVVLWDGRTGKPLSNIIVWQDTRTQGEMNDVLADPEATGQIRRRTGLRPDAYFSASKLRWLLDHTPEIDHLQRSGDLRLGTLDTWLIWKLTGGERYVSDVSTASRTLLFNVHTLNWDDWLLDQFEIPVELLAGVCESTGDFGAAGALGLPGPEIPIVASLVDQPSAMIGQGCLDPGEIKATYGTGCFINLNTGQDAILSTQGLLTLVAWQRDGVPTYGLDGGVFSAGANLNWLRDKANLVENVEEIESLCAGIADAGGVTWIPAQVGLGAPYWDRDIRGAWTGIGLATERAHLVRAVLEGIALRVAQVIRAMNEDSGSPIERLRADGGLTRSRVMMQIQADLLGIPVEVLEDQEATSRGVCSLAARHTGLWDSDEHIRSHVRAARILYPTSTPETREKRLADFDRAISLLKS